MLCHRQKCSPIDHLMLNEIKKCQERQMKDNENEVEKAETK